ncbi:MAG: hypothetical protein E7418_03700 [Ruminococcaceae bacterium]|nr:hypothetical protein [Oscillospiraceae bacterium]
MRRLVKTVAIDEVAGEHKAFGLDYYVLQKDVMFEGKTYTRYGLEICKRATRENGTPYLEYRKIFDLFHSEEEAEHVLLLLAAGAVTPISMKDILEDLLGTTEFVHEEVFVEAV